MTNKELVLLIPVFKRPKNVEPLLDSFYDSDSAAIGRILFIASRGDDGEIKEIEKFIDEGFVDIVIKPDSVKETYPCKINYGISITEEPWILSGADDVFFDTGWWEATKPLRNAGAKFIGLNDLSNPRVMSGSHSTHVLIKRDYINDYGVIDRPGVLYHEGYNHWFCDDEMVITAKIRGEFTHCSNSYVVHLHPYFGRGEWDEIYAKGESTSNEDREEFEKRVAKYFHEYVRLG